jgi:hypothetical protein
LEKFFMPDKLIDSNESHGIAAPQTPFCGSLRSKKFFLLDTLASEAQHYLDASNHCWCRETQQVVGPDGGRANPDRCTPGRSCYTSALERT